MSVVRFWGGPLDGQDMDVHRLSEVLYVPIMNQTNWSVMETSSPLADVCKTGQYRLSLCRRSYVYEGER